MQSLELEEKLVLERFLQEACAKVGKAVTEKFRTPVGLSFVNLSLLSAGDFDEIFEEIKLQGATISVSQEFFGDLSGCFFLPLSKKEARQFLNLLSGEASDIEVPISSEERDILTEFMNMVCGYVTGSIADNLQSSGIHFDAPAFRQLDLTLLRKTLQETAKGCDKFLLAELKIAIRLREVLLYFFVGFKAAQWEKMRGKGASQETADRLSTKAILLVDDSFFSIKQTTSILAKYGYSADAASSAAEALAKYLPKKYQAVMLDLTLPDLDGIEVLKTMKKFDPEAKVIVVTARGQESVASELRKLGAIEVIFKPLNDEKLLPALRKLS